MNAMGITQIAAVLGPCVAGGAYLPIMSDETLMVEGASIYLAGPYLVKAAIGEDVDTETLGGATTHTEISGIADYKFKTEHECMDHIKKMISMLGEKKKAGFFLSMESRMICLRSLKELLMILNLNNSKKIMAKLLFVVMAG